MFQFVFMQIRPSPNTCVYYMRKTFLASYLKPSNSLKYTHTYKLKFNFIIPTCNRPSNVLCIVTHLLGCAPFVVMAVISESSSSLFSLSFFTRDSIALFENPSLSPPCLWHIKLCTILRQASAEVGAFVANPDIPSYKYKKIKISPIYLITKPTVFCFSYYSSSKTHNITPCSPSKGMLCFISF